MPAIGHEIGRTMVVDGVKLRLIELGDEFAILLENTALMSTLFSASEALATITAQRLGQRPASEWLIGGYGMGCTLLAVLAEVGGDSDVTLAKIVPAIIE
jgi:spermidine synthase